MVAVAIIGVLASSVFFVLNPGEQLMKSRDSQRKNSLDQIKVALDAYYNDHNRYPAASGGKIEGIDWGSEWVSYIAKLPKDPLSPSQDYLYESPVDGDIGAYRLYADLERCSDSQGVIGVDCLRPYNYSVNSSNLAALISLPITPMPTTTPG
ncbi:type II secretion system protein GspG, partial [Patescibacteria group bacterium]|nr:type II secretion system protein GspG [Patescibacteria group bacterium]